MGTEQAAVPDMQGQIVALTEKWCDDLRGKDGRVGIGAALNVLTTIGNYSPADTRKAAAIFLRRVADEFDARRDT